jgi:cellulose synthase/poly-beta-1,6-N-acetylglucosamine synthase-like glycosyltransferase
MGLLADRFANTSPRFRPQATPWPSLAIHGAVVGLLVLLLLSAAVPTGVLTWSVGIAYVSYDSFLLAFVFWQTLGIVRATPARAGGDRPSMSVVVAAYNEAGALPATLAALFAQTDPADQIVIADDGSDDASFGLLRDKYGLVAPAAGQISAPSDIFPSLRWLRMPRGGKARALNAAIATVETDILLTVDADTLLAPGAVAAMRHAFAADGSLVAATGVLAPVCAGSGAAALFQWFQTYEYIRNFLSRYAWMQADGLLLISGAFAGFRRAALADVGGFDTDCLVEDYELIHRLRRFSVLNGRGWTTAVLGSAFASTDAPATVGAFLRQRRRWFGGFLQTQYWYRDMVGNRRYGRLGTWMLPVKAADAVQPLYGLAAFVLLLWSAVTGHLAVLIPVGGIIAGKICLDLAFHLWSVRLYRRWIGDTTSGSFGWALLAALAEPFSFQLLRHIGAALGWVAFLSGSRQWGRQERSAAVAPGRLGDYAPVAATERTGG